MGVDCRVATPPVDLQPARRAEGGPRRAAHRAKLKIPLKTVASSCARRNFGTREPLELIHKGLEDAMDTEETPREKKPIAKQITEIAAQAAGTLAETAVRSIANRAKKAVSKRASTRSAARSASKAAKKAPKRRAKKAAASKRTAKKTSKRRARKTGKKSKR
jgi:hypothetical protein